MIYRKMNLLVLFFILLVCYGFHSSSTIDFLVPENWPTPSYNFDKNPLTKAKIELGRHLFYEPLLSKDTSISCSSCHSQYTAFTHVDHDLSHGIDDRIGTRNSPSLMNLAWSNVFMWDGAVNHLDMQALAPITHEDEMGDDLWNVIHKLQASSKYRMLFAKAFGASVITGEHLLKAIAQFELILVSANAKYDQVMRKEAVFTAQEKNGFALFQQHCNSCHQAPLFTNNQFANNGLAIDTTLNDMGRMEITKDPKDAQLFKVPTLRNVEFSYPYMHDGRFEELSEVLKHYAEGIIHRSATLSPLLEGGISLKHEEQIDLIAFLLTLTDKEFLFNPQFSFPREGKN
jgi:cytochrome c peroxidase